MFTKYDLLLADSLTGKVGRQRGSSGKIGDASAVAATLRSSVLGRGSNVLEILALMDYFVRPASPSMAPASSHASSERHQRPMTTCSVPTEVEETWDAVFCSALRAALRECLFVTGAQRRRARVNRAHEWFVRQNELRPAGKFRVPSSYTMYGAADIHIPLHKKPDVRNVSPEMKYATEYIPGGVRKPRPLSAPQPVPNTTCMLEAPLVDLQYAQPSGLAQPPRILKEFSSRDLGTNHTHRVPLRTRYR
eukprot:COSAG05_NODE_1284_length_5281_cov_19.439599_6_plen_249_part_00